MINLTNESVSNILIIRNITHYNSNINSYHQYNTQKIETKDSLLVLYTVKEWGIKEYWTWALRSDMYYITPKDVSYFIAGTFYSPDKRKNPPDFSAGDLK